MAFSTDTKFLTWPFLFFIISYSIANEPVREASQGPTLSRITWGRRLREVTWPLPVPVVAGGLMAWALFSLPRTPSEPALDAFFMETSHKPRGTHHGCHLPEEKGLLCLEAMDTRSCWPLSILTLNTKWCPGSCCHLRNFGGNTCLFVQPAFTEGGCGPGAALLTRDLGMWHGLDL